MNTSNEGLVITEWQDYRAENLFSDRLIDKGGYFWGRLGGSDFDATARYFTNPTNHQILAKISSRLYRDRNRVRNLNGFFDKNRKTFESNYLNYLKTLHESNLETKGFMFANSTLIDFFVGTNRRETTSTKYATLVSAHRDLINYGVIEGIHPFLNSIKKWGAGSKILIVSPFSDSLQYQHTRSAQLLKDFEYPQFELVTYTSPITYNNRADISSGTILSRCSNWNSELQLMISEISSLDFDVALLSCGSYAPAIGVAIQNLGKKAIYLGGVLNVFFNIQGQRYDNEFVKSISNLETRIAPLEASKITMVQGGRKIQNEGIRAYFK